MFLARKKEKQVDDADLIAAKESVSKSSWMIRPCEVYDKEYSECTKIKSRFDQYFIYGKMSDCSHWQSDIHNCRKWNRDEDYHAAASIIEREKERVAKRKKSFTDNDVMKEREVKPPPNWNDPLPHHISEKHKGSYLEAHLDELNTTYDISSKSCCIS